MSSESSGPWTPNRQSAALIDRAIEAFGRIDLLVSTLGGAPYPLSFDAISEAQLLETVRLNTWPAVALIRAALARGLGDDAGSVVTISSGSPRKTTSAMVSYASAKAALNAMTRTIAADLAGRGVRVNAVSPGLVRTTATRAIWEADGGAAAGSALPLGRLTEADDIAAAVCFLLSDDARQITGITLDVDGGNHLSERMDADPVVAALPLPARARCSSGAPTTVDRSRDLLPHLLGRHAGKLHPQVQRIGTDFRHRAASRSAISSGSSDAIVWSSPNELALAA